MVQVKDLPDLMDKSRASEFLYCTVCGAENSASKGDYFMLPENHVFKCCNEPMILAVKHTTIVGVK